MTARAQPQATAAHPADLVALAAHIAEDEAGTFGRLPSRADVEAFADGIVNLLFPDGRHAPRSAAGVHADLEARCVTLVLVLAPLRGQLPGSPEDVARAFLERLPHIHEQVTLDAEQSCPPIEAGDLCRGCPRDRGGRPRLPRVPGDGFGVGDARTTRSLIPRMIAELAHRRTGADIHPRRRSAARAASTTGPGSSSARPPSSATT